MPIVFSLGAASLLLATEFGSEPGDGIAPVAAGITTESNGGSLSADGDALDGAGASQTAPVRIATDDDRSIVVFGDNDYGQHNVPEPNADFLAIAAGYYHVVALRSDGSVEAWGRNNQGQCDVPEPNGGFVGVASGWNHSLAIRADGSIAIWGSNSAGQSDEPVPNSGFVSAAAGSAHTLALTAQGTIVAWGANGLGQCDVPAPNEGFVAVAACGKHSLGLRSNGSVAAWGENSYGESETPNDNDGFIAIAAGYHHSLALRADGTVVTWGADFVGLADIPAPNEGFVAVAAGSVHSLGLKADGTIVGWGASNFGQLDVPAPNSGFGAIAGNGFISVAIRGPLDFRDCDTNGVADALELFAGTANDCNTNEIPDACDIAAGTSRDCQDDGVPDECPVMKTLFSETFEDLELDGNKWTNSDGVTIDDVGIDEPSPPYSLRINDTDNVESRPINLAYNQAATLRYAWQRTGGGDTPYGGDLLVEWRDGDGEWSTIGRHYANGEDMTTYIQAVHALPPAALHARFQLRFRPSSHTRDWFVDDVFVEAVARDCNNNDTLDECDVSGGTSADCNTNGTPDECELALFDCNGNGVPDDCDIVFGASVDCDTNGVPDECELPGNDCNSNGTLDRCDVAAGDSRDCNQNIIPDECEFASLHNCCEPSNETGCSDPAIEACVCAVDPYCCNVRWDRLCVSRVTPTQCGICVNGDCNGNGVPDDCDVIAGSAEDCNGDLVPDLCEPDCNGDGKIDACEIIEGLDTDCNENGIPDACDLAAGTSKDCNGNGTPDICEADCNNNGYDDSCDVAAGTTPDCNSNGVPDWCDIHKGVKHVLIEPPADTTDRVGCSVGVSGERAVVGAPGDEYYPWPVGEVYVVRYGDRDWSQEAVLKPVNTTGLRWFGERVAIDGDVIAATAIHDEGGTKLHVFRSDGAQWAEEAVLTAPPSVPNAVFISRGTPIAVESDYLLVLGLDDSTGRDVSGAIFVFHWTGGDWQFQEKLVIENQFAEGPARISNFGFAHGQVVVNTASSSGSQFGLGLSAFIYRHNPNDANGGDSWEFETRLPPIPRLHTFDNFGLSAAVGNDTVALRSVYGQVIGAHVYRRGHVQGHAGTPWSYDGFLESAIEPAVDRDAVLVVKRSVLAPETIVYSTHLRRLIGTSGGLWLEGLDYDIVTAHDYYTEPVDVALDRTVITYGLKSGSEYAYPGAAYAVDFSNDCDGDGVPDECELASGQATDANGNGYLDACDRAEINIDGRALIDLDDHAVLAGCMTGPCADGDCEPALYSDALCALADLDFDGDVDLVDFDIFQKAFE